MVHSLSFGTLEYYSAQPMTNRRSYQSIAGHHAPSEGLPPAIAANERGDLQSG